MMHSRVPATANAQIAALRDDMDHPFVVLEFIDGFRSAVC